MGDLHSQRLLHTSAVTAEVILHHTSLVDCVLNVEAVAADSTSTSVILGNPKRIPKKITNILLPAPIFFYYKSANTSLIQLTSLSCLLTLCVQF